MSQSQQQKQYPLYDLQVSEFNQNSYKQLRQILTFIGQNYQKTQQELKDQILCGQFQTKRLKADYQLKIVNISNQLSITKQKLQQAQCRIKQFKTNVFSNVHRQFQHLVETSKQRDSQISNYQKQIDRQQSKILNLQNMLHEALNQKQIVEQGYIKMLQHMKTLIKEITSSSKQNELDVLVEQKQSKKLFQIFDGIKKMHSEFQHIKKKLEHKITNLKEQNIWLVDSNLALQTQVQVLKQKFKRQKYQKRRQTSTSQTQFLQQNNFQKLRLQEQNLMKKVSCQLQNIFNLTKNSSIQIKDKMETIMTKIQNQSTLFQQIVTLHQQNKFLKDQINNYKTRQNPHLSDELLKTEHPQLYEFFEQKKNDILKFQNRLQNLQINYGRLLDQIQKIGISGLPELKRRQQSQEQKKEKQRIFKFEVKKESQKHIQQITVKFEKKLKEIKKYYQRELQQFKQRQEKFTIDIERLQKEIHLIKNENQQLQKSCQKLSKQKQSNHYNRTELKLSKQKIQPENRRKKYQGQIKQSRNQSRQISNTASRSHQFQDVNIRQKQNQFIRIQQQSTQSPVKHSKYKFDNNFINYLQSQNQELLKKNNSLETKIQRYKSQIKFLLRNYKAKNAKLKYSPCCECYSAISQDKQDGQALDGKECPNCKLVFHKNQDCFMKHSNMCKKKEPQNRNTIRTKRQTNRKSSHRKIVEPKIDYFDD